MDNTIFNILIIEDERDIRELLRLQLELQKYNVYVAENGEQAKKLMDQQQIDLFLVDRMLPDISGLEVCSHIRRNEKYQESPIILVTALSESHNIIEGLDAGADDYITKPFDINVLHARVRAHLRKINKEEDQSYFVLDQLEIDHKKCRVKVDNQEINLTSTEFQILSNLAKDPGVVHTREKLIETILGDDVHVTNRTIDTHIAGLRKKLNTASKLIETIRGIGYRLKDNE